MRRVRTDVSHRIRRQSSIFAAWWFRALLGLGLGVIVILLVGPWIAGRFGAEFPRSLSPLLPWGGVAEPRREALGPTAELPPSPTPGTAPAATVPSPTGRTGGTDRPAEAAAAPGSTATPTAPAPRKPRSDAVTSGSVGAPPRNADTTPAPSRSPAGVSSPASEPSTSRPGPPAAAPPVYWVQVGAFLDHRNADRLVERLRSEGHAASTTVFEQSRVAYRVLLTSPDGAGTVPDEASERVRGLGFTVEDTPDGPAVTGLVPLRRAVEVSHALRRQGLRVRLKQEVGSATFRVVRVGSFATSREAEATLAALSSRGYEGVVVRER
jgi:cell division septation protein DedD